MSAIWPSATRTRRTRSLCRIGTPYFPTMVPIDPACFQARDHALPGREMAELNELCRAIVEALRQPRFLHVKKPAQPTDNVVALRRI